MGYGSEGAMLTLCIHVGNSEMEREGDVQNTMH